MLCILQSDDTREGREQGVWPVVEAQSILCRMCEPEYCPSRHCGPDIDIVDRAIHLDVDLIKREIHRILLVDPVPTRKSGQPGVTAAHQEGQKAGDSAFVSLCQGFGGFAFSPPRMFGLACRRLSGICSLCHCGSLVLVAPGRERADKVVDNFLFGFPIASHSERHSSQLSWCSLHDPVF